MAAKEVPGRMVEATVTDHGVKGNNWGSVPFTRIIQAKVRTRLVYEGRPMFLAADPPVEVESEVAS
jgi:hypothetical protein